MFGFFKKDLGQITDAKFQMLAILAASGSMSGAMLLIAGSRKQDEGTLRLLFHELLVFACCLIQMRTQSQFKINDGEQVMAIIRNLQRHFGELADAKAEGYSGDGLTIAPDMLKRATTDEFLLRVCRYAARDYRGLGISDDMFNWFCQVTGTSATVLKHAGVNLATCIFQMGVFALLIDLEEKASGDEINLVLKNSLECKEYFVEKIDRLLKEHI